MKPRFNTLFGLKKHTNQPPAPSETAALDFGRCREILRFLPRIPDCCALLNRSEIDACTRIAEILGLPSHHDPQKNWDTLKALYYIVKETDPSAPILDAGSSGDSAILKWLSRLGYQKLFACDIRPKSSKNYLTRNIEFSVQDITRTSYPDGFFQAVTCISVIEHGVDLPAFVQEMSRILSPEGLLMISTDYWSEPIDCSGIFPYGQAMGEMKVLGPDEINDLLKTAAQHELFPCTPMDLNTQERAVRWERVNREYTFAFVALQKASRIGG